MTHGPTGSVPASIHWTHSGHHNGILRCQAVQISADPKPREQTTGVRDPAICAPCRAWSRAVCHSANREVSVAATEHEVSSVFFRRVLKLDFGAHQPEILEFTRVSEPRLVVPSNESGPRPRWESLAAPARSGHPPPMN